MPPPPPPLRVRLGAVVRRRRTAAGYSQEAFADRVGVHRTFMSTVERGLSNVSLETLERIAAALGAHAGTLLLEAETPDVGLPEVAVPEAGPVADTDRPPAGIPAAAPPTAPATNRRGQTDDATPDDHRGGRRSDAAPRR